MSDLLPMKRIPLLAAAVALSACTAPRAPAPPNAPAPPSASSPAPTTAAAPITATATLKVSARKPRPAPDCADRALAAGKLNPACPDYQGYLDPGGPGRGPTSGELQHQYGCEQGYIPKSEC